jgi:hypothetical protein
MISLFFHQSVITEKKYISTLKIQPIKQIFFKYFFMLKRCFCALFVSLSFFSPLTAVTNQEVSEALTALKQINRSTKTTSQRKQAQEILEIWHEIIARAWNTIHEKKPKQNFDTDPIEKLKKYKIELELQLKEPREGARLYSTTIAAGLQKIKLLKNKASTEEIVVNAQILASKTNEYLDWMKFEIKIVDGEIKKKESSAAHPRERRRPTGAHRPSSPPRGGAGGPPPPYLPSYLSRSASFTFTTVGENQLLFPLTPNKQYGNNCAVCALCNAQEIARHIEAGHDVSTVDLSTVDANIVRKNHNTRWNSTYASDLHLEICQGGKAATEVDHDMENCFATAIGSEAILNIAENLGLAKSAMFIDTDKTAIAIIENGAPLGNTDLEQKFQAGKVIITIFYAGEQKIGAVGHWVCTVYKKGVGNYLIYRADSEYNNGNRSADITEAEIEFGNELMRR